MTGKSQCETSETPKVFSIWQGTELQLHLTIFEMTESTCQILTKEKKLLDSLKEHSFYPTVYWSWLEHFSNWHLTPSVWNKQTIMTANMHIALLAMFCVAGFPGSAHDSHVWWNMDIYHNPNEYFSLNEYVLTDTVYEPTWYCISLYECIGGNHLLLTPKN